MITTFFKKHRRLLISLLIPLAVGGLTALLTSKSMDIYKDINQPPLAPPGWLFPVVWTVLYALMGLGSYLILPAPKPQRTSALTLYAIQLILNFLWPLLFFNLQLWFWAFLLLLALLMVALLMTYSFLQIRPLAGWLQIPYCLWLSFAAYLNWMIFLLN